MEQLAGTELAVEAGAADLEQEIGAAAGPAHLLGVVHAAADREIGHCFGQRGATCFMGIMRKVMMMSLGRWSVLDDW